VGITLNSLELIINARTKIGSLVESIGVLGWQTFWHFNLANQGSLNQLTSSIRGLESLNFANGSDAIPLFKRFGANTVDVYDANHYEGANIIHNFNYKLPQELGAIKHDIFFDGGSLEHIFNVPVAIENCMRLVRPGGMYMGIVPCDGWAGHGFYQFSPEFFYRVFSREHGYQDTQVVVYHEIGEPDAVLFPDPRIVGRRIEFRRNRPVSLFVTSIKSSEQVLFTDYPNQSDYEHQQWK
jgi:hypothetical protein